MRIGEFGDFFKRALVKRKRVLDVGPPGIGKTFTRRQICAELNWDYIGICAPLQSPVKIGGYPRPPSEEGGDASHALFDGIARAFRATGPTHLHIDDLGMANGETLKAIVDLVQFGRIDNRTLPDCVVVGASSNDVGHGADVQGLIEPLKSRFHSIIKVESHIDDVIVYGLAREWPSGVLAYLRNSPKAIDIPEGWKPSKTMTIDYASPRGWDYAAEWIREGFDDAEVLAGCIGKGYASDLLAFMALMNELPDVNAVLIDPEGSPVPDNPSARFLVSMALAAKMDAGTFGQAIRYLNRLPQSFRALAIRDCLKAETARVRAGTLDKKRGQLHMSRDWTAWACSQDGKEIAIAFTN